MGVWYNEESGLYERRVRPHSTTVVITGTPREINPLVVLVALHRFKKGLRSVVKGWYIEDA